MRFLGFLLLGLGIVVGTIGGFVGAGRLFGWNGRHPVAVTGIPDGASGRVTLQTKPRVRYTAAVQVVFDREGLAEKDGALVVEAKIPLTASLRDDTGRAVLQISDWLDPNVPPSVLYGHAHGAEKQHARGQAPPELLVERLLGPWPSGDAPQEIAFEATLGPDRVQTARILESRIVVYDDTIPDSIKIGFGFAALGVVAAVVGAVLLSLAGIRRFLSRRGGNRRRQRL